MPLILIRAVGRDRREQRRCSSAPELRDGRVLVIDYLDKKVLLLDTHLTSTTQVGRNGNGPGEYGMPRRLLRFAGDSTLVSDYANTRLLLITPDGKPGRILESRLGANCGVQRPRHRGVQQSDGRSNFFTEVAPIAVRDGKNVLADSAAIERWSSPCSADTVAFVPNRFGREGRVIGSFVIGAPGVIPLRATTQWTVAANGRVAIVRHEPYRVDFINADGRWRDGSVIPYRRVRVTAAVKQHWRDERQRPAPVVTVYRAGGSTITMQKRPYAEPSRWPEFLPPFLDNAVHFAEDGRLWVQSAVAPDDPPTFDVIDQTGKLVLQVHLRPRSRVVGFGKGVVYVVRRDDDDLEYLERYRVAPR